MSPLRPRSATARLPLAGFAAAALGVAGCSSPTEPPFDSDAAGIVPRNVIVTATSDDQVVVTWTHADEGESGFRIWRQTGTGTSPVAIAEVPRGVSTYTDPSPRSDRLLVYSVQATYGSHASDPSVPALTHLGILPPSITGSDVENGVTAISFLPPDFERFQGFRALRIVERDAGAFLDATTLIQHDASAAHTFRDRDLGHGVTGDRLRYHVSTDRDSAFSRPAVSDDFQWSYPTRAEVLASGIVRRHTAGHARFVEGPKLGIVVVHDEAGGVQAKVISPEIVAFEGHILFDLDEPNGQMAGAVSAFEHASFAYRASGSSTVSIRTFDTEAEVQIWETTIEGEAAVALVETPEAGGIAYISGNALVAVNATDGAPLRTIPLGRAALAFTFLGSDGFAVLEEGGGDLRAPTSTRVVAYSYPAGGVVFTGPWHDGSPFSAAGAIAASADGELLAANVADRTHVYHRSGRLHGSAIGHTTGFVRSGTHAIIIEGELSAPTAYRIAAQSIEPEERFARSEMTASFSALGPDRFFTFHADGGMRIYRQEETWSRELFTRGGAPRREPDESDVPRVVMLRR